MKKPTTKNLRSEAAIKEVIKNWKAWKRYIFVMTAQLEPVLRIQLLDKEDIYQDHIVAEIDLRELVKKRKPLTGVKKQLDAIVRGKKKGKK